MVGFSWFDVLVFLCISHAGLEPLIATLIPGKPIITTGYPPSLTQNHLALTSGLEPVFPPESTTRRLPEYSHTQTAY